MFNYKKKCRTVIVSLEFNFGFFSPYLLTERGGHRDERYRSSRHDERGGEREHRSDRDRYDGDRDRGGGNGMRRGGGDDRRGGDRDKYSRGGRDGDDGRHSSRYDSDRRRDHRGPRDDEYALPRTGGGTPREDVPPRGGDRRGRGGKGRDGMGTPERRSPTPEGAVPLSQRKRKASGWDVHAPGYEQYTALQAKQTGEAFFVFFPVLSLTNGYKASLTFLGLIVHRYLPFLVLRVYLLQCLFKLLAWASAATLTFHVNLVDYILAASRPK